jgi:hypothetical protein
MKHLAPYAGSYNYWIEDKIENAELGVKFGLDSILVEHGFNMHYEGIPRFKNWKQIYEHITGEW